MNVIDHQRGFQSIFWTDRFLIIILQSPPDVLSLVRMSIYKLLFISCDAAYLKPGRLFWKNLLIRFLFLPGPFSCHMSGVCLLGSKTHLFRTQVWLSVDGSIFTCVCMYCSFIAVRQRNRWRHFSDTVVHIFGTDVKKIYSLLSTDRPVCLSVPRGTTAALTSKIWRKIITYVDWNLERFAEWLCRTLVKTINLTNHVSQIFSLPSTPSTSAARFFVD